MVVMFVIVIMVMFVIVVMMMIVIVIMVMLMIVVMVMLVIVVMVMLVMMPVMDVLRLLLSTVYRNLHMCPGDAALHRGLRGNRDTRKAQSIHFINKSLPVFRQLQQGRGQHIARGAHRAFQIQRLHSVFLPLLRVKPARSRASTSTGTSRICSTIPRIGLTTARVQTKSRKAWSTATSPVFSRRKYTTA